MKSFGSKELISCLTRLGFQKQRSVGSSHLKFKCPNTHKHIAGERSFIEVLQGKSQFDPKTQSKIINNLIKKHNFTRDQIESAL